MTLRLLGLIACLTLISCSRDNVSYLRVGANNWTGYMPLFLAQESGLYNRHFIKVLEMPSSSDVIKALQDETLDVAALTLDETLSLLEHQYDLQVIWVLDTSAGGDVLLAKPSLQSMADLRGKRIAVENTAVGALMLDGALESAGLSPSDVTIVSCAYDEHEGCYQNVDALVTFEPLKSRLLAQGAVELFSSKQIPDRILDVLVVRRGIAASQPEQLKALLQGYLVARQQLHSRMPTALDTVAYTLQLDRANLLNALDGIVLADLAENRKMLTGTEPELIKVTAKLQRLMLERRLIGREVQLGDLARGDFLPEETP